MNQVKKIAGIIWMLAAPLALYYLVRTASAEISAKPALDTKIQWFVFVAIFIPIAMGFAIFGYYAWKGEYNYLPGERDNN